jgi:hypothetical protein
MKSIIITGVLYAISGLGFFTSFFVSLYYNSYIPAIILLVASIFCFASLYFHIQRSKREYKHLSKLRKMEK